MFYQSKNALTVLTRPVFGTKPCALCDIADFGTYFSHNVDHHTSVESVEAVINCLREGCESIFTLVKHFTMYVSLLLLSYPTSFSLNGYFLFFLVPSLV